MRQSCKCEIILKMKEIATPVCALVRNDVIYEGDCTPVWSLVCNDIIYEGDCHTSLRTGSQ